MEIKLRLNIIRGFSSISSCAFSHAWHVTYVYYSVIYSTYPLKIRGVCRPQTPKSRMDVMMSIVSAIAEK
jgi:hypothetical protein